MKHARQAALETLHSVIVRKHSLNQHMANTRTQVYPADQALYQALVYGVLREHEALSSLRSELLRTPLKAQAAYLGLIINLGLYQLLRMQLGDHGVINETVNLAKHNHCPQARSLINAVLRRTQRERDTCRTHLDACATYNLPAWLKAAYPQDKAQLAHTLLTPPPFTLRLAAHLDRDAWLQAHPDARANPLSPQAVTMPGGSNILGSDDFRHGNLSVQDAAAQLSATFLKPQNHEIILDACAAPGGKTGHILELAPQAQLTALDHDPDRLSQVQDNLTRLGQHAALHNADAAECDTWWDGKPFDAILLDAPCSGSGILRRHPDIAYLRTRQDLQQYPHEQSRLLNALWPTLKPGGRLLYVTCSILPDEDQHTIRTFLDTHSDARLCPLSHPACRDTGYGLLHLPDRDGDGFFHALVEKAG